MGNVNLYICMGRLTRDPEVKYVGANNTVICSGGLAITRRFKRNEQWEDEPVFIDFDVWGARGEAFSKHMRKGSPVFLRGELRFDQWEDKDGNKRSKLKLNVDSWEFVESKSDGQGSASGGSRGEPAKPSGDINEDDIPF